MSIRLPLKTVLDVNNSTEVGSGPASTVGGVAHTFELPQDVDGVVVKLTASVLAGGMDVTLQTTDDGGTTWYDVARSSTVSNANNAVTAEWIAAPVISQGLRAIHGVASVGTGTAVSVFGTIGGAGASTLGQKQYSGLPILSQRGRVFLRYTAAVTSIINERIRVYSHTQSGSR